MPDGANRGVVDTREAMELARTARMDLIEVAPNADPPVCRIIDYGKFTYEREKKERAARKSQKQIEIKGIQLRPKTTDHHLEFKIRAARRFLEQGNKVKVTLKFRGRENTHLHVARNMIQKIVDRVLDLSFVEVSPNVEGKGMLAILAPTPATIAAAALRTTQSRLEREREQDIAAGYDESEDVVDEEIGETTETSESEELHEEEPVKPVFVEKSVVRKAASRDKVAKQRANEQFGLP